MVRSSGVGTSDGTRGRPPVPRWVLVCVAMVFALTVGLIDTWATSPVPSGDADRYLAMATDPFDPQEAPWGHRIAVPFVVWLLPIGGRLGMQVANLAALVAGAGLLAVFVRREFDDRRALLAVGVFLASGSVSGAVQSGLVDLPAMFVMLSCLVLVQRSSWWWTVPVLAAGVFVKESTAMLLVPLALMAALGSSSAGDRRRRLVAVAVSAAVVAAIYLVLTRTTWVVGPLPSSGSTALGPADVLDHQREQSGSVVRAVFDAAYTQIGVLAVPMLFGLLRARGWTLALVAIWVPVVATMAVATDWPRLLGYGILSAVLLVGAVGRWSVPAGCALVGATALQVHLAPHLGASQRILLVAACTAAVGIATFATFRGGLQRGVPSRPGAPMPIP